MAQAVILLLVVLTGNESPKSGDGMMCEIARMYVAMYGEPLAREYARRHRWSRERIAAAEKCLAAKK